MPFISKDWRSPGEAWVKTEEGWEKLKVLECSKNQRYRSDSGGGSDSDEKNQDVISSEENSETAVQPHCQITIKCTKEIAGFNELDEVVKRLDFRSAVRDVRRFNYICALLDLLVGQQMTALSGCAQKALLAMLEEVASHVSSSQYNPRGLRKLIAKLRAMNAAVRSACWGGPLGSQLLWHQHGNTIERILTIASDMQIRKPAAGQYPQLQQLPEECLREVALRLADHRDLAASAAACRELANICREQRIWRELVCFHFTPQQIDKIRNQNSEDDWEKIYHTLRKTHGLREDRLYAETLSLCRHCRCLFWRSIGHPCIADLDPDFRARLQEAGTDDLPPSPVPPAAFLKFFSL